MNKHSELEIFKLCERLAELLGDEEAIADLKYLYNRHPEMFTDMQDISNTINNIVTNPDIIKKNPKAKNDKDYMAAKILNDKKWEILELKIIMEQILYFTQIKKYK
ncbi:MAG: hypothetical protein IKC25_05750 [Campylobacter sp.]|nr:hypothetical protein [Campylobacter sp.]